MIKLNNIRKEDLKGLNAGEIVYLTGVLYTMRDQAHKRFLENNDKIFNPKDSIIYYTGPTPTKDKEKVGSIGPTTSYRMDEFFIEMTDLGVIATIGKGPRDKKIKEYCKEKGVVYFLAIGGAGAFYNETIINSTTIGYKDLGTEAIRKIEVKDFPIVVAYDTKGNDIFEREMK